MSDLFDKLNLLLRSSLDNLLSTHPNPGDQPRREDVSPEALTARSIADLERQIVTMRKQIDAALSDEDDKQERLNQLQQQVASYDEAADAALERGDEEEARRLIQQMQQQRRLASMVSAELEDHRSATSEFIVRVNMLEATVSDAKRAQGHEPSDPAVPAAKSNAQIPPELVELGKATATAIGDAARTLRERAEAALAPMVKTGEQPTVQPNAAAKPTSVPAIKQETPIDPTANDAPAVPIKVKLNPTGEVPTATPPSSPAVPPSPKPLVSDKDVESDLAARRSRLSKPD